MDSAVSATVADVTMTPTCLMAVTADPLMNPQCSEPLVRRCSCWGQAVPFCLKCKIGLDEAAAADAKKPQCTDTVCHRRSGCSGHAGGWGGQLKCQESAKGALDEYEFNYKYHAHLKKFIRQSFRLSPYARVEYPNQDAQGYASDEPLSPLEGEATAEWNPRVSYADAYVHAPWCRGTCSHRCNPTGRAPDFERYRHDDYCRGGCGNKCARADAEGMKVVTMLLPGDIITYGFRPADELDVPSPRYAPTDDETSGHYGDA